MKMSIERFEHEFKQVQGSWALEGIEFSEKEIEQLRLVCTGKITKIDYDRWIQNKIK